MLADNQRKEQMVWIRQFVASRCPGYLRDQMDDICQESIIKLMRAEERVGKDKINKSYTKRTVMSVMIDIIRQHKRRSESVFEEDSQASEDCSPEGSAEMSGLLNVVYKAMDEFPQRKRQLLLMYFRGVKLNEIQELTGYTMASIRNDIYRGKSMLAEMLKKTGYSYEVE